MSSPKGYTSQQKEDRLKAQFATVEQTRPNQFALTTLANLFVYVVASKTITDANSTKSVLDSTAHGAQPGDVLFFTSGALLRTEVKVASVTANTITLAETLAVAPGNTDGFDILRHIYARVSNTGLLSLAPTPIQFVRNGVNVNVIEDDVTPANNQPLPVKLTGVTGDVNITAGDLNVNIVHTGAGFSSVRIGDGTTLMGVTLSNEGKVSDATTHTSLTSISGQLPATLGQKAMAASLSVALASDQSAIPVTQSGTWNINNISGTVSLPTGASTSALQTTINTSLTAISGQLPATLGQKAMAASLAVVLASDQSAIPVSQSGTWNINNISGAISLPTGAATSANQTTANTSLSSIDGKLGSLGQKAMAGLAPVVLASDQSAIPVTQSGTWNINNVSGTVSLPTGAATSALQTTANTSLTSISGQLPATLGQKLMAASLAVVLASDQSAIPASQSGTWNINNVSGTVSLPTGASTSALQTTANTSLASIDGKLGSLGQKTMAGSAPIVIASDQSNLPVVQVGRTVVTTVRNDYTGTSVTTGAWTQLVASLGSTVHEMEIFDSSGQTMEIGTGAAGSEARLILVFPGGNGRVPTKIASGTRVAIRAVSANASVGELDINLYDS